MKGKILIPGPPYQVGNKVKEENLESQKLKKATLFFENANFITTKYNPMNNGIHLILEFESGLEMHVEGANCGYAGQGPHASVDALVLFGLDKKLLEALIFHNDAVQFEVGKDNEIKNIRTDYLFYPPVRESDEDNSQYNKIKNNRNVTVDLEEGRVLIYNPQRTCWNGFLNLITQINDIKMTYYIGNDSPLESGLFVNGAVKNILNSESKEPDLKGVKHVNLLLRGSNFRVACLIDEEYEAEVIEATYLALTGKKLFASDVCKAYANKSTKAVLYELLSMIRHRKSSYHDEIAIEKKTLGNQMHG